MRRLYCSKAVCCEVYYVMYWTELKISILWCATLFHRVRSAHNGSERTILTHVYDIEYNALYQMTTWYHMTYCTCATYDDDNKSLMTRLMIAHAVNHIQYTQPERRVVPRRARGRVGHRHASRTRPRGHAARARVTRYDGGAWRRDGSANATSRGTILRVHDVKRSEMKWNTSGKAQWNAEVNVTLHTQAIKYNIHNEYIIHIIIIYNKFSN